MAAEEKEDRIKGIPPDGANLLLCDFRKCKSGASLEVDIVREGEGCERSKGGTSEEIGGCAVYESRGQRERETRMPSGVLSRNWSRSATASRSFSSNRGSYDCDLRLLTGKG